TAGARPHRDSKGAWRRHLVIAMHSTERFVRILAFRAAPVIFLLAAAGTAQRPAVTPAEEWQMYGHDLAGTRFSPLTDINTGNVARLAGAWSHPFRGPAR